MGLGSSTFLQAHEWPCSQPQGLLLASYTAGCTPGLQPGAVSQLAKLPAKLPLSLLTGMEGEVSGETGADGWFLQAQERPWSQPQGLLLASYTAGCTPGLQVGALSQLTIVPVVVPVLSPLLPVKVGCC